jgi:hypothetical protein
MSSHSRRPDWVARTYRISESTVEQITKLAEKLEVCPSRLVDILLQIGLDEVESGRRQLRRRATSYALEFDDTRASDSLPDVANHLHTKVTKVRW